ncbi:MAG: ferrochelatase [Saprospirales bacterium]|nr:ferrochelatase [Saprospirales bacterium]
MIKKTGILLVNLGTPDSASNSDVFKYLNEFLTDGRVIDYPWLLRHKSSSWNYCTIAL